MMNWRSFVAFRFFRSKKNSKLTNLISYISIITTFFLVALLMLIFGILRGFQQEITKKIIDHYGFLLINSEHESFDSTEAKNIIKIIGNDQFEIHEEISNFAIISNEHASTAALIKKSPENLVKATIHNNTIKKLKLSNNLRINIVTNTNSYPLVIDTLIQESFPLPIVYLNEEIFQKIFNVQPNQVNSLKILLKPDTKLSEQELDTKLNQITQSLPNLKINNWKELNVKMLPMTNLEKKIFYIIVALLIFMCSLVNFLAITMFIFSKKNTIRILKTQHANRKDIVSIFTQYNAILATISIIFGLITGYLLCLNINIIIDFIEKHLNIIMYKNMIANEKIQIIINPRDVALIFFSNFLSMIFSAIIMSWEMYSIEIF